MPHDVITFGEAMIRLAPPNFRRLEQARSLDVQVGGAELNTAVALARLGRSTAWVSRLTDNPLGRLIANHAREAGVSTDYVLFTSEDRVGLYFLEFGAATRASSVLYDRRSVDIAASSAADTSGPTKLNLYSTPSNDPCPISVSTKSSSGFASRATAAIVSVSRARVA